MLYLTGREPGIAGIIQKAFQDYTGSRFRLHVTDGPINVHPVMLPGELSDFVFVDIDTLETRRVVQPARSGHNRQKPAKLPKRIAVVEHRFEKSVDTGIVIYVSSEDVSPAMLPARVTDLSADEQIVLRYTARYAASYGGNVRYRRSKAFKDTGMTDERWDAARKSLWKRGLLTRQYGLTPAGRNEVSEYWDTAPAARRA